MLLRNITSAITTAFLLLFMTTPSSEPMLLQRRIKPIKLTPEQELNLYYNRLETTVIPMGKTPQEMVALLQDEAHFKSLAYRYSKHISGPWNEYLNALTEAQTLSNHVLAEEVFSHKSFRGSLIMREHLIPEETILLLISDRAAHLRSIVAAYQTRQINAPAPQAPSPTPANPSNPVTQQDGVYRGPQPDTTTVKKS